MAATTSASLQQHAPAQPTPARSLDTPIPWQPRLWNFILTSLSLAMLLIHGYHPLAEDGGLYVAGIQHLLNPALYPHDLAFVTAHLHYSIFAPSIAALVRITHLPIAWVLFLAYCFSLWFTLYAGLQILRRCIPSQTAQLAGVALLAVWATLPVAGTSLLLMDPYLTARSFSTPLSLLAIAFALDESTPRTLRSPALRISALCLLLAACFHPLMAAYAIAMVITLRLIKRPRPAMPLFIFATVAVLVAALIHALAPPESPATTAAAISRYYWFLSQWQWYELCGLLGPFCILLLLLHWKPAHVSATTRTLLQSSLVFGSITILIALLFARQNSATHLVARLQPLRGFLLIYAAMALLLGATLTQRLQEISTRRRYLLTLPILALVINAVVLFAVQRSTFAASQHIELPSATPTNAWSRAFLWARDNTPTNALFALDANYITTPGEDAQGFRATALRSTLPDFSKDGGEASITPALSNLWQQGAHAQANLSTLSDAERDARLIPLAVTWMVLRANTPTTHPCPYRNEVVKVCTLIP